ncbi:MAG: glycosyltransferase family A protein [Acidaminococcaceae bacterium]|nr:glycosyltransferase family A protein [Acidaminococcaceae bacterium]
MRSLEILLSCMYEKDYSIILKSNIKTNAVIINQCNENSMDQINISNNKYVKWINSTERGLSKSRNMAIRNSCADICLIADNDEKFEDDYEQKILKAYEDLPGADIIIFDLHNKHTKLNPKIYLLKRLEMLRVCSLQITFKRKSIIDNKLIFDVKLGAGTGNGAGEENKFLLDCYDKGLKIYHVPEKIAVMTENESTWFTGFDEDFFYKRGMSTRYILGFGLSCMYGLYYAILKHNQYKKDIGIFVALKNILSGILDNKLMKE